MEFPSTHVDLGIPRVGAHRTCIQAALGVGAAPAGILQGPGVRGGNCEGWEEIVRAEGALARSAGRKMRELALNGMYGRKPSQLGGKQLNDAQRSSKGRWKVGAIRDQFGHGFLGKKAIAVPAL